jgi:DNA-binding MarR family transcriptional regulator
MGSPGGRTDACAAVDPHDPVVKADDNWRQRGWPYGARFRAALSMRQVDDMLRARDAANLQPFQLTSSRHEALAVLYFSRDGQMSLGTLGQRLMVHPTSVTATVDTLERLGFVERAAHPSDRRQTLARITSSGRDVMEQACQVIAGDEFGLGALSDGEAETLYMLLKKVRHTAGLDRQGTAGAESTEQA